MQKETELVQHLLAEVFAPLSQRDYSDVYCKSLIYLYHTTTSGEILVFFILTHASEQAEATL